MLKRIFTRLIPSSAKQKLKTKLFSEFGFLNVTRPYVIDIPNKRFENKVIIVTGGSGALGRAISCRFAFEGAVVYVCGMTNSKIESVVNEITELGGTAYPCKLNVTNCTEIEETFNKIAIKHGKINALITCAGGSSREKNTSLIDQDVDIVKSVLDINLLGTILCAKEAAKHFVDQKEGKIIALSSTIGIGGKVNFSEYAAAKGGVISFVKSLAMELGQYGINVNCVTPGIVQREKITQKEIERIKSTNYLNDFCIPEDIANAVVFLTSDEASFITGQNIVVDGGRSLGLKGD
jgi:3-oxoacyl-[acyl-carrier protein] reductase